MKDSETTQAAEDVAADFSLIDVSASDDDFLLASSSGQAQFSSSGFQIRVNLGSNLVNLVHFVQILWVHLLLLYWVFRFPPAFPT